MLNLNDYIVHYKNGSTLTISASNLNGAKAQVRLLAPYIDRIERVYKSGERATPPFEE